MGNLPSREKRAHKENEGSKDKRSKQENCLILKNKKTNYFKQASQNILQELISFLSISDCLNFVKLDQRSRNIILERHKYFPLFIELMKSNFLDYYENFYHLSDEISKSFEGELMARNSQLSQNEAETLLGDLICTISKYHGLMLLDKHNQHLIKYIKILLSHPKCQIRTLYYSVTSQDFYSHLGNIIASNSSLESIIVNNFEFTLENVNKLELNKNKSLKRLSITQRNVEYLEKEIPCLTSFRILLKILNSHLSIEDIELRYLLIDHELDSILFNCFTYNKTIISLELYGCEFYGTSVAFLNYFTDQTTIKKLSFECSKFNRASLDKKSLPIFTNLTDLSFAGCSLNNDEIIMLSEIVRKSKSIQSLDISSNEVSSSSFPHIISILEDSKLKEINLCNTKLKDIDFIQICEALTNNSTMESIDLNCNECSSEEKLFALLEVNKTLKKIKIYSNKFNEEIQKKVNEIMNERR